MSDETKHDKHPNDQCASCERPASECETLVAINPNNPIASRACICSECVEKCVDVIWNEFYEIPAMEAYIVKLVNRLAEAKMKALLKEKGVSFENGELRVSLPASP